MKQYAWIMAACLTAAMVSGCGVAQKGEAGNRSESTAASSERSEVVVPEGTEAENEKGATAVKLSEGEIYRDDFDGDGKEEEFSFTFEGDGKDNHNLELYAYTMQMNCDGLVYQKELYGGVNIQFYIFL